MEDIQYIIKTQRLIVERLLEYKKIFGKEKVEADYGFEHYVLRVLDGGGRLEFWKHGCEYTKRTDLTSDFEPDGYLSFSVSGNGQRKEISSYPELEFQRFVEGMAEYPHLDARWSCPQGKLKCLSIHLGYFATVRYLDAEGTENYPSASETEIQLKRFGLPQKLLDAKYVMGEAVEGWLKIDCAKEIDVLIAESELGEFYAEFEAATAKALADHEQIKEFVGRVRSSRIGKCAGRWIGRAKAS